MLLLVCLLCLFSLSSAQTPKNGYTWNEILNHDDKIFYVAGFVDCTRYLKPNYLDSLLPKTINVDQVIKSFDEFYADYKNLTVNFPDAFFISCLKFSSASNEKIEWFTRYVRADAGTRRTMDLEPIH